MKEIYNNYYKHFSRFNQVDKKSFEIVADAYRHWYKKFLPDNKNIKILDIGCGMGHFLYFLEREGYQNFIGIDISEDQINFCKKDITEKVLVADIFEFLKRGEKFNVISANDVIEHQPKEKLLEFLNLIFNSLNDGGILFVKTDNMSNPFGLRGRYMDVTHEIGFTEHSLREILESVGFQKINIIGGFSPVKKTLRSLIGRILMIMTHKLLKFMFFVQGYPIPEILTKDIIAIAHK